MEYLDKLFEIKDPYCVSRECREIFFQAMREAFEFHYENNEIYRKICEFEGISPSLLKKEEDLKLIPHIMVNVLKWYTLKSLPSEKIAYEFTSSGTSGQKSHILWDEGSKIRQSTMRERLVERVGIKSDTVSNYIVFSYSPDTKGNKGAANTHITYASFTPAKNKFFAIHKGKDGAAFFDMEGVIEKLKEYAEDKNTPLRIVGFPAFIHETILELKKRNLYFNFNHKESMVITGGGWKDKQEKSIPFDRFKDEVSEVLGIPKDGFRDIYGFVEHGVPYITCPKGHFHVPVYAKIFVRKPGTLEFLGYNQKGLLQFLSPYNLAQPTISVLSTDYGMLKDDCDCGIETPYIELLGRAGKKKHKGCAITAAELLQS
ncbi:acyl-protein synthetase [Hippea alviniae]|uniref:LuxE/PaaK family acyltransferase n=1 Tax=Hippea alviniae TaxID=1279027 RepID=UPI0003B3BB81|nr:acyl-protein synthetase [Hippea alviniae]